MKKSRLIKKRWIIFFLLIFILPAIFLKDKIILYYLKRGFSERFPGGVLDIERFMVWPGYIEALNFRVMAHGRPRAPLRILGSKVVFKFSMLRLFEGPFGALSAAHLVVEDLSSQEFALSGLVFSGRKETSGSGFGGRFSVKDISYKKETGFRELEGVFKIYPDAIFVEAASVAAFGGRILGRGKAGLKDKGLEFEIDIRQIEAKEVVRVLGIAERFELSGVFAGQVRLVIEAGRVKTLSGRLDSQGGGNLVVSDTSGMNKNLINIGGANIVVENLRNYRYDIGHITLGSNAQDIVGKVSLEGQSGNRDLEVVWHPQVKSQK